MLKAAIFFFMFNLVSFNIFSQVNYEAIDGLVGPDALICVGNSVSLGVTQDCPDVVYSWTPSTGLNDSSSPFPIASPFNTTTYTLTITFTDGTIYADEVTVYVVEGVDVTIEGISNPIFPLDYMESRELLIEAELIGINLDNFSSDVNIRLNYFNPNGNASSTTSNFGVFADFLLVAPNVINNLYYSLNPFISIDGITCDFPQYEVDIHRLNIQKFNDISDKPWKIVVGETIEYEAYATTDCNNWNWEFETEWNIEVINGTFEQSGNNIKIPLSELPSSNDKFGDSNGEVIASCVDDEGNIHSVKASESLALNKTKIFFEGEQSNSGINGGEENWFFYYKQVEEALSGQTAEYTKGCSGGTSATEFGCDGSSGPSHFVSMKICKNAYLGNSTNPSFYWNTIIESGFPQQLKINMTNPQTSTQYLASFIAVVEHERVHGYEQAASPCGYDYSGNGAISSGEYDTDNDLMVSDQEMAVNLNPNSRCSAEGHLQEPGSSCASTKLHDGEIYPGGPREKAAYQAALSIANLKDWAKPGTNW